MEWTIFVPEEESNETWQVQIKNLSGRKRRLSLFWVAEFDLQLPETSYSASWSSNTLSIHSRYPDQPIYFIAASKEPSSFETSRETFLGPGQNYHHPAVVAQGKCSRSLVEGKKPIGVLQKNVTLGPKAELHFDIFVGAISPKHKSQLPKLIQSLTKSDVVIQQLDKVKASYSDLLQHHWLRGTGEFDEMYSRTLAYQCLTTCRWREQSVVSTEITAQSLARAVRAGLIWFPAEMQSLVTNALHLVMKDGRLPNSWSSRSVELDNLGDAADSLTLAELVIYVLKETGDQHWLATTVPYYDGSQASVLEHVTRLTDWVLQHQKSAVIEVNGEQSTALTARTVSLLKELIALHLYQNDHHLVQKYQQKIEELMGAINKRFWVGPYYLARRSENDRSKNRSFDLAAQIAVIQSGVAAEKAEKILTTIKKQFGHNVPNISPPYAEVTNDQRSLSVAGKGENGGVDLALIAELARTSAVHHQTEYAWELLNQATTEFWQAEYRDLGQATSQSLNDQFGRAEALTSVVRETIIGIQPTLHGLKIDPHLPPSWRVVEMSRRWRGADYHIRIQNPLRAKSGVDRIVVDGIRVVGNVIRPFSTGNHFVEVVLG